MARIWVITDPRISRDRRGKSYNEMTVWVQHGDLVLGGNDVFLCNSKNKTHFSPQMAKILFLLMLSPKRVSRLEIIEALWPNPDDEPGNPDKVIDVKFYYLRHALAPFGFKIDTLNGQGWMLESSVTISNDCKRQGVGESLAAI